MNHSNDAGNFERFINALMGVKTDNTSQSFDRKKVGTKELDVRMVLIYILGTILQIGIMVLALVGMDKLVMLIDNYSSLPNWLSLLAAGLFLAILTIRSRIFSVLDNTRSRQTYDSIIRPSWAPPPQVFPIVWMTIAFLRVISSLLVWQEFDRQLLILPLILFVVHLALGDTWNTIFTVERRLGASVPVIILGPWLSALVVTGIYWHTNPVAGIILAPSCIWLTVAAVLVLRIWQLNGFEPLYPLKITAIDQ